MPLSPPTARSNVRENRHPNAVRFCKIVTFYEDFSDAVRAVKKFDSIVQALSPDRPVHATSWSFNLLGKAELNSIILDDVSHADVLVLASNGNHGLPERIASWVEICMHAGPGRDPVIVALHDEGADADGVAGSLCSSLKTIAERTDATFMCNRDLATVQSEAPAGPARAWQLEPHAACESAHYPAVESVRWWGIND